LTGKKTKKQKTKNKQPPITIRFLANRTDMMYATDLALATNVSVLRVPLHCYHGHLSFSVLDIPESTGVRILIL
jgi:hypothetical protein